MKKPSIPPALTLFVLAPMIGELLSGSSLPLEFFNPIAFLFLASLYGSGAIVMRELKIRWKKDLRSLLLLGAAYGILEEGLMVKSFFDPNWIDLGILGSFGRWLDVNWVWAEMLIIYHAVFSITIPIVLVELIYPARKSKSWIGKRLFAGFVAVLGLVTIIGFYFGLTPYKYYPPAPQYLSAIIAMSLFIYVAFKLPARKTNEHTARARSLFIAGSAGSTAFFLLLYAGPQIIASPIIIMLLGIILVFSAAKYLVSLDWNSPESTSNRLAVVAGGLSFLIILAFLQEFNPSAKGMSLVGLATIAGILLLKRKIKTSN